MPNETPEQRSERHKNELAALENQKIAELNGVTNEKIIEEIGLKYTLLENEMRIRHLGEKTGGLAD